MKWWPIALIIGILVVSGIAVASAGKGGNKPDKGNGYEIISYNYTGGTNPQIKVYCPEGKMAVAGAYEYGAYVLAHPEYESHATTDFTGWQFAL